jgi:tRNA threonylcarbamoyladenosine biosynthesis protein TsaB
MAKILCIETATQVCSVAIAHEGSCLRYKEITKENAHSSLLTVMIQELMEETGVKPTDFSAVAVSMGPGSYTGLRIGASVAKGMCYALKIPLIAVSTLKAIAWGTRYSFGSSLQDVLFCPMIDARRMEVYTALFDADLQVLEPDKALILTPESFDESFQKYTVVFSGDGSVKTKTILTNQNAVYSDVLASARWMVSLADEAYQTKQFADTAYFVPYYLKEFQTTTPRKKV